MTTARLVPPRTSTTHANGGLPPTLSGASRSDQPRTKPLPGPELTALRIAYSDISTIASSLEEEDSWLPTRCLGWSVRDLLVHLLGDVQRGLVALATPAAGPADRDAVTWWTAGEPTDDPGTLLGHAAPADWPDERWALLGTGRVPPGGGERRTLGAAAARLPLLC
jgi:hypothetical protein